VQSKCVTRRQEEEVTALKAIYDESFHDCEGSGGVSFSLDICSSSGDATYNTLLKVSLRRPYCTEIFSYIHFTVQICGICMEFSSYRS